MRVAVIGAGPVGIFFTKMCLDIGHDVTLIDSGNFHHESELLNKKNYIFESPSLMPDGVHKIGGGSTLWRGRISEFQEDDFKVSSGTKSANWPFDKNELKDHYSKLYKLFEAGDYTDAEFLAEFFSEQLEFLPEYFQMRIFRYCEPNYFVDLFTEINNHPNLKILAGHLCAKVSKQNSGETLQVELLPKNWNLESYTFDSVVIACGTLQSTALLQRSTTLFNGETPEILGKYLMEHIEGYVGKVWSFNKKEKNFLSAISLNEENRSIEKFHGAGVALSLKNLNIDEKRKINLHFELRPPMALFYFSKFLVKFKNRHLALTVLLNIALFLERSISFMLRKLRRIVFSALQIKLYSVYFKSEEIQFKDSQTFLPDQDENFLTYSHKISELTWELISNEFKEFEKRFNQAFKARIKFSRHAHSIAKLKLSFGSNWHPMGTTRMGSTPRDSIVDRDLALHQTPNCYVLSASVFPTGSNSNPTFTALALAIRLSENKRFSKSH